MKNQSSLFSSYKRCLTVLGREEGNLRNSIQFSKSTPTF